MSTLTAVVITVRRRPLMFLLLFVIDNECYLPNNTAVFDCQSSTVNKDLIVSDLHVVSKSSMTTKEV